MCGGGRAIEIVKNHVRTRKHARKNQRNTHAKRESKNHVTVKMPKRERGSQTKRFADTSRSPFPVTGGLLHPKKNYAAGRRRRGGIGEVASAAWVESMGHKSMRHESTATKPL
jgi:hypothetical protein